MSKGPGSGSEVSTQKGHVVTTAISLSRRRSALLLTLLVALFAAGIATIGAQSAFAAPAGVQMPFPCGETWYASTYRGHPPSEYSIDWNLSGVEDHNKPVLAGASGTATVQPFQSGGYGNYVDVNIGGGWALRYAHLENVNVTTGQTVNPQTQIGTVGASGLSGSPPPYHLHYEQRYFNGNSWSVQPATFNGSAISYAYSLPGNAYTSGNCTTPPWGGVGGATFYGGDTLTAGEQLNSNQYILSADARFALILQTDGNLVLYNRNAIWDSHTGGSGATRLVMQTDGNLVLYNVNTPVWQSQTGGTGSGHLTLQTDGNLVTYNDSSGSPTWWTGSGGHAATIAFGSALSAEQQLEASSQQYLRSPDKRYAVLMQSDGNLILYGPGYHVLWNTNTSGATRLVMQTDGNLVLYNVNTALWQSQTGGTGSNRVVMQSDGNLVTYTASDVATWQSFTSGQL